MGSDRVNWRERNYYIDKNGDVIYLENVKRKPVRGFRSRLSVQKQWRRV